MMTRPLLIKPRILILSFVFSPNIGGVESHLDDLCSYLLTQGYKIVVITYQPLISAGTAPIYEQKNSFTIFRIPWFKFNLFNKLEKYPVLEILYIVPAILIFSIFYLLFKGRNIDVIQTHGFNMAIVGCIVSLLFRKRFTVNTHVSFLFKKLTLYSFILKIILNRASRILVLTQKAQEELSKIGVIKEKIFIYHQWIDEKLFTEKNKLVSRRRLGLDENKFIVFFAGRFIPAKGVKLLLNAIKQVKKDIVFVFVGSGSLSSLIQKESNLNSKIIYTGLVDKSYLPYYYSASDVCIIPSIGSTQTYSEGIPRVIIESLTCGTPIVATKSGGVVELLNKNVGFFIRPASSEIAKIVNKLSHDQKKLNLMKPNCIRYAKDIFSQEKNTEIIDASLQ